MDTAVNARVAAEVRAEMARQQVTQAEVGARIGKPQHWVSRRLTGDVTFSPDELAAFAAALGVPISQFIGDGVAA